MKQVTLYLNASELKHLIDAMGNHYRIVKASPLDGPHAAAEKAAWLADLQELEAKLLDHE